MKKIIFLFFLQISLFATKTVLVVGGIPNGGEEQVFCRNIPGLVMNGFYVGWSKVINQLKKENFEFEFILNTDFCRGFANDKKKYDQIAKKYDLFIFLDLPSYLDFNGLNRVVHKSMIMLFEPPAVVEHQYEEKFLSKFKRVLTWNDDLIKLNPGKFKKFYLPVYLPYKGGEPFSKRRFSCLLCGNKSSGYKGELYSQRVKIIQFFKNNSDIFELYGPGWESKNLKVYRGEVPYKDEVLKRTKFNFCLENTSDSSGYITEKIFDAFESGSIPIYQGPPNIAQYIPSDCYIHYEDFHSLEDLKNYMDSIDESQYNLFLNNIQEYLNSDKAKVFSPEIFSEIVVHNILDMIR